MHKIWVVELNEINDYAGQFYHDSKPSADAVIVVATELKTFVERLQASYTKGQRHLEHQYESYSDRTITGRCRLFCRASRCLNRFYIPLRTKPKLNIEGKRSYAPDQQWKVLRGE